MALTAAEKRKKMQEIKKNLADKRAKSNEKSPRAKKVEANRNKRKVAYQEKLAKKKTGVKGTQVNTNKGKMSANDKVGPSHLGRSNPKTKKSTAPKTSVVNKKTTGMVSEKIGPNMGRGTKKRGSVARGNETYNKGPSHLKSKNTPSGVNRMAKNNTKPKKKKMTMMQRARKSMNLGY